MFSSDEIKRAELLCSLMSSNGLALSVAESCTGGLLGALITSVSGASKVFMGGVIVYDNSMKISLGVKADTLLDYGAVSKETAESLVENLYIKYPCDIAVSITGIAGPSGGFEEKPVGLVYTGLLLRKGIISDERYMIIDKHLHDSNNERNIIRKDTALRAIDLLIDILSK